MNNKDKPEDLNSMCKQSRCRNRAVRLIKCSLVSIVSITDTQVQISLRNILKLHYYNLNLIVHHEKKKKVFVVGLVSSFFLFNFSLTQPSASPTLCA